MRVTLLTTLILLTCSAGISAAGISAGAASERLRFFVIGDAGTGRLGQYRVGQRMAEIHGSDPVDLVLMLGDNLYGREREKDFQRKFERPYATLHEADVPFYAALGNHDGDAQVHYPGFNMNGSRYYSFRSEQHDVLFLALDSTDVGDEQIDWLAHELATATERWRFAFFHHPIYSSGRRHGPSLEARAKLEPLFVCYDVQVVLAGHEHFYERLAPQEGVNYFISGAAGKIRRKNIRDSPNTAAGYDARLHFMLFEVAADELRFEAINDFGVTVDQGKIRLDERQHLARVGTLADDDGTR